jgi:hypothetical protein
MALSGPAYALIGFSPVLRPLFRRHPPEHSFVKRIGKRKVKAGIDDRAPGADRSGFASRASPTEKEQITVGTPASSLLLPGGSDAL